MSFKYNFLSPLYKKKKPECPEFEKSKTDKKENAYLHLFFLKIFWNFPENKNLKYMYSEYFKK